MNIYRCCRTALKSLAVLALSSYVAGCSTTRALDVAKPMPREERINSLALEQCIRENGEDNCRDENR